MRYFILSCALFAPVLVHAVPVKIADSDTSIPGGTGKFNSFNEVELDAQGVTFAANNVNTGNPTKLYRSDINGLSLLADTSSVLTSSGTVFNVSMSGTNSVFGALPPKGVYRSVGSTITPVAKIGDPLPQGGGTFAFTGTPLTDIDGSDIVFSLDGSIYTDFSGVLAKVGDGSQPALQQRSIVSVGLGSSDITRMKPNGDSNTVVDVTTPVPGKGFNFAFFRTPMFSGSSNVVFNGSGPLSGSYQGLFLRDLDGSGAITKIADTDTPIPGGTGNFTTFSNFTVFGDKVVFASLDSNVRGSLYLWQDGSLQKLFAVGDAFAGSTIVNAQVYPGSLYGNSLAFDVILNNSTGVYETVVPEPSVGLAIATMLLATRRLRQHSKD